ncbi:hypothetical protein BOTBODRAFT_171436 [Botryobasidium botryosum FD-172 SS1]|uniref:Amino acid permease/ SLC12A domain-containing protein n=1 Tax=Botryobasidium botryosum (strain FD-172 SS1) TaxID=930990 RepID=A0A067N4C1_BOTB1|nr:hypothetical protein BOTBODRAFT_171436 [Botryobasidium botryosum FD-172 SS1]
MAIVILKLGQLDSFAASFCPMNFITSVRFTFFTGLLAGGPLAMWTSYLIAAILTCVSAAVLAEICSALPLSGSVYIWAAEAAGPRYGRFIGLIVAWWMLAAWMAWTAVNAQASADYLLALFNVYDLEFPGGVTNDNVKWRVLVWAVSEGFLLLAIVPNYLPQSWYPPLLRTSLLLIMLDFLLCLIWLPIRVSKSYGLRTSRQAFLQTNNGTGAPPGWNWLLSFFYPSSTLVSFDAAGHIAEETKDASNVAARSIFTSVVAIGVCGFSTTILFLFCAPLDSTQNAILESSSQPFVVIYGMALGHGGATFMAVLAALGVLFSNSVSILTTSRLVFALARDGALPFSSWVQKTTNGRPQNAVTLMYIVPAVLLCAILPSSVAFTSLVSGGVAPMVASYGLIALMRLIMTPNGFKRTKFSLGKASRIFYAISAAFNMLIFAVNVSPLAFPVSAQTLNFAGVIVGAITIFGILSFLFISEDKWLRREQIHGGVDSEVSLHDTNISADTK